MANRMRLEGGGSERLHQIMTALELAEKSIDHFQSLLKSAKDEAQRKQYRIALSQLRALVKAHRAEMESLKKQLSGARRDAPKERESTPYTAPPQRFTPPSQNAQKHGQGEA